MPTLYFDNFRGFHSTFISLKDVNFFVGENSTGKTSVLKLIGVLFSPAFWRKSLFGYDETSLGSFRDIITQPTDGRDYFEVAILDVADSLTAIRLRFIEKDNIPVVKELQFIAGGLNVQASIDGDFIKYRFNQLNLEVTTSSDCRTLFHQWESDTSLQGLPFRKKESGQLSLLFIIESLEYWIFIERDQVIRGVSQSIPSLLGDLVWMAPIRSRPKRAYYEHRYSFDAEGSHMPFVLERDVLTNARRKFIIEKFGSDSGLYEELVARQLLQTSETESPDSLITPRAPFELNISLDGKERNIVNVGYGVPQVLPLIVEVITRPSGSWFALQQPEVHLHPKAQAAFGEFVYKSSRLDNAKFIIETHSDYTIDRYRLRVSQEYRIGPKAPPSQLGQVLFFTRTANGNMVDVIEIQKDGNYPNDQPGAFRGFFIKEKMELLNI